MPKTESITIQKTSKSKLQTVDFNNLDFGKYISDHMAMASYTNKHWQPLEIVPYGDLAMSPAMLSLHYGQSIFEGMKAYKNEKGSTEGYEEFVENLSKG